MTLVIAAEEDGRIVMGADSAVGILGHPEEVYVLRHLEKVARCGPYLLGWCDDARVGQVLCHHVEWPAPPATGPLEPFLVREVVPELRRAVLDAGAAREGRCFLGNATVLLVAVRGELYSVGSDLTVVRSDGPACIGCGRHAAYPVMEALRSAGIEPVRQRIETTLEIVARWNPLVAPPFRFVEI